MLIQDVMHSPVITVEPGATLEQAYGLMLERRIRHLPVVEGHLLGVITDRDIHRATSPFSLDGPRSPESAVKEVMVHPVISADPEDPIEEAARLMRGRRIGCLPVVGLGNEALVGIVTATDLFEVLLKLTGVEKPSGRLEVALQDRPGELARLTGFLAERHINIHSLLTYPDQNQVRSIVRLGTLETRKLADALREMGYQVLWPPVKTSRV